MSTRCDIIITDNRHRVIKLFHRQDGYPQGVGKFLLEEVIEKRLNKCGYYTVNDVANFLVKNKEDEDYMITVGEHPDIEYRYYINVDTKGIKCQKVRYAQVGNHFELDILRRIDLKEELNLNK